MEGHDIFDHYDQEQEELVEFINTYPGVIRDGDSKAETLYKMNEHLHNVLEPITEILENEEMLRKFIKQKKEVPEAMRNFEDLPKAIEDESNFVQTIDY